MINATFRGSTNQFRGTGWEFNRNTALNATGFFKPSSGVKLAVKFYFYPSMIAGTNNAQDSGCGRSIK